MLPVLREAVRIAGGVSALAAQINVTRSAVYQWKKRVPGERAPAISAATGIPLEKIRPDLYGGLKFSGKRKKKRHV
jgi:DNA-binding transcriptional regulator YdaS (Cro superfamily)